jgi:hypothetical protein
MRQLWFAMVATGLAFAQLVEERKKVATGGQQ